MQFNFDNRISQGEFYNENMIKNQTNMKYDSFEPESGVCFLKGAEAFTQKQSY